MMSNVFHSSLGVSEIQEGKFYLGDEMYIPNTTQVITGEGFVIDCNRTHWDGPKTHWGRRR